MKERIETFCAATLGALIFVTVVWAAPWFLFSFASWRLLGLPKPEVIRFGIGACVLFGGWMAVCHEENN